MSDIDKIFIFLFFVCFLLYVAVVISKLFLKKTDIVNKYKRGSLSLFLLFLKLFLLFVRGVIYIVTNDMQTSTRVLGVIGLAFTAANLSALGWGSLKLRREALFLEPKEKLNENS